LICLLFSSSKYYGVSWITKNQKWLAQFKIDGIRIYGGYFHNEVDAAKQVNQLCEKFGILPKNPELTETQPHETNIN